MGLSRCGVLRQGKVVSKCLHSNWATRRGSLQDSWNRPDLWSHGYVYLAVQAFPSAARGLAHMHIGCARMYVSTHLFFLLELHFESYIENKTRLLWALNYVTKGHWHLRCPLTSQDLSLSMCLYLELKAQVQIAFSANKRARTTVLKGGSAALQALSCCQISDTWKIHDSIWIKTFTF